MTLVLIEVANEAAVQQLRLQQGVRVVRVVEEPTESAAPAVSVAQPLPKPSVATLIGSLSPESAQRMLQQNAELRNEWERES